MICKTNIIKKFVSQRAIAYRLLQSIHDNIYTANISEINPLGPEDFVVVMHPMSKEVVFGEGELVYNRIFSVLPDKVS